jgi:hypothetical protein
MPVTTAAVRTERSPLDLDDFLAKVRRLTCAWPTDPWCNQPSAGRCLTAMFVCLKDESRRPL